MIYYRRCCCVTVFQRRSDAFDVDGGETHSGPLAEKVSGAMKKKEIILVFVVVVRTEEHLLTKFQIFFS